MLTVISHKAKCMTEQRKRPAKLVWTQRWRKLNKKGKVEEVSKRRKTKTTKFQRAINGATLDDIKKKRTQKPEFRNAQKAAALREVKDRQKAKKVTSKAANSASTRSGKAKSHKGKSQGSTGR